jgi:hypothetical protein
MTTSRREFLAAAIAVAVSGPSLLAAEREKKLKEGEWEKLGERSITKREDKDVIEVKSATHFTAVSFRINAGKAEVQDVKITFDDGQVFDAPTKVAFKEGEESGRIDLPGASRKIKDIHFLYRSLGRGDAIISVFGKIGK